MTQMKSAESKSTRSVGGAMGRIFGLGIPATAIMAAALAVVFAVVLDGCSSKGKKSAEIPATQNSSSLNANTVLPAPSPTPSATPAVVAKKKVISRPSTVTYTDNTYGVSFRYPRKYTLLTPQKSKQSETELAKLPMNFTEKGGTNVAAIELNNKTATSFLNVSVLKGVSAEQCDKFAKADPQGDDTPIQADDESGVAKVSVRGVEFTKADEVTEELEARYYHHFVPGAEKNSGSCYEFSLGVAGNPESINAVEDVAMFEQLERIFGTVKIKPENIPAVTASVPSQTETVPNPQ